MNSKIRALALMTSMLALTHPMPPIQREFVSKKDTSHLRKKCKSCKQFKGEYCQIVPYRRPQDVACEKYEHR